MYEIVRRQFDPEQTFKGNTPEQRLTNLSVRHHMRDALMLTAFSQWRYSNKDVWIVVASQIDGRLLLEDFFAGYVTNSDVMCDKETVPATQCHLNQRNGRISIITYAELVQQHITPAMRTSNWSRSSQADDLTIFLDCGCGDIAFDMAVGLMGVARLVEESCVKGNTAKAKIAAYAVSNITRNAWGNKAVRQLELEPSRRQWPLRQPVIEPLPLNEVGRMMDDIKNRNVGTRLVLYMHGSLLPQFLQTIEPVTKKRFRTSRGLVAMGMPDTLNRSPDLPELDHWLQNRSPDPPELDHPPELNRLLHLWIEQEVTHLGFIGFVRWVFVDKTKVAWIFDPESAQMCLATVPRSKAELRLIQDTKSIEANLSPVHVQYCMSEQEFEALPEFPRSSMALTRDLSNTLLFCIALWPDTSISEMPITLQDLVVVEEYLRRLALMSLAEPVESTSPKDHGLRRAYCVWKLTPLGSLVVQILLGDISQGNGIKDLGVACLVARSRYSGPTRLDASPIMSDTVDEMAAIFTQTDARRSEPGTMIWTIIKSAANHFQDPSGLPDMLGAVAHRVGMGPIWLAVSVWNTMRAYGLWRAPTRTECDINMLPELTKPVLEINTLSVLRKDSFNWDDALRISRDASQGPKITRLSPEEQFELDKALVRSFMDRILMVPCGDVQEDSILSIVDLVSRRSVRMDVPGHSNQLNLKACREMETSLNPDKTVPRFIYCIYTALVRIEENGTAFWQAYDVSYVQTAAIREVAKSLPKAGGKGHLIDRFETDLVLSYT